MPDPNPAAANNAAAAAAAASAAAQPSESEILARGVAQEAARRASIAAAFTSFAGVEGVAALQATCEADTRCAPEQANAKLLEHLGARASSAAGSYGSGARAGESERDRFRAGVSQALLARAGIVKHDEANNFRGYTLFEIARMSLKHSGIKAEGMDKMSIVAMSFTHSTSDFPNLLANVAQKSMLSGYEAAAETFPQWTRKGTLSDFKVSKRADLSMFPALEIIPEGAEYKYATIGERGEGIQLATYGRMFSITRQAIINDDLDAFSRIPSKMGEAARRTIGNLVYAILTGNPVMSDGVALFHATHANLLTAATINTDSVDTMRIAMGTQKDNGVAINNTLGRLIVPLALQGKANVVRNSEFEVGAATRNNTTPNSVRGTFDVIADARLDTASATAWYGVANGDSIEVAYLDGVETPFLDQMNGWDVDGTAFKVRIDAGVKAVDFKTLAKNPGA